MKWVLITERLSHDPVMRAIVDRKGLDRMGRLDQPDGKVRDGMAGDG